MHPGRSNRPGPADPRRLRWRLILTAIALAGVVGCSTLPTAPRTTTRLTNPQRVEFAPRGADAVSFPRLTIVPPDSMGKAPDSTSTPTDSLEDALEITGLDGGEVKLGRFDVALPPGTFKGKATVGIRIDPSNAMRCELHITPASANGFLKPVVLRVNCAGALDIERLGIVWMNEVTGDWEEVDGSTVDPATGVVSAPLQHFSQYAVTEVIRQAMAGW